MTYIEFDNFLVPTIVMKLGVRFFYNPLALVMKPSEIFLWIKTSVIKKKELDFYFFSGLMKISFQSHGLFQSFGNNLDLFFFIYMFFYICNKNMWGILSWQ